jgi:hypothetical protein
MDLQLQLFDDFNYYRAHTRNVLSRREKAPVRDYKQTPKRLDVLKEMIGWCSLHDVDPRLWLYSLFVSRKWLFAPTFNQLIPRSQRTAKKSLRSYSTLSDLPIFQKRIDEQNREHAEAEGVVWDPNRDLNYSAEGLKRRFLNEGDVERCMREMETTTFGYHPKSFVCARCPVARRCEQALQAKVPFDITALRSGQLTAEQARRIAYYGR